MSNPKHFDISHLPSIKAGMTAEEENTHRRKTCRFIEEAGRILKLPNLANATAMVFFHQFYAKYSFMEHDRFEVAVACVLLAAKIEESPKKLMEIITRCLELKRGAGKERGEVVSVDPKSSEFVKLKESVLLLERVVLHTIGFELSVDHPYKFLPDIIQKLTTQYDPSKRKTMFEELMGYSMTFVKDSIHTTLCLQFPPQLIATACVYMAGHFAKVQPKKSWLDALGMHDNEVDALSSICGQIMDLIVDRRGTDVEAFKGIRANLEQLKGTAASAGSASPARSPASPRPPPPPPSGAKHRAPSEDSSASSKRRRTT
ncbi:Cyclin [Seminavis robusta]|uniref:Cyclin n=1 Tax=Seminavis robusta TaxID=568900 RepID=A0A9N8D656_9STRA|nr:Cyclin [Seminavis robusta]|eukprot:Sro15_g010870.1 Cyclin (316) ;mRNA; f:16307-17420